MTRVKQTVRDSMSNLGIHRAHYAREPAKYILDQTDVCDPSRQIRVCNKILFLLPTKTCVVGIQFSYYSTKTCFMGIQ